MLIALSPGQSGVYSERPVGTRMGAPMSFPSSRGPCDMTQQTAWFCGSSLRAHGTERVLGAC